MFVGGIMKKNRNSFFAESNFQSYNPYNMNPVPYQGPVPNNYNMPNNDIESRFAKIERQLNRLDYRLSKLENTNQTYQTEDLESSNSNMYMV